MFVNSFLRSENIVESSVSRRYVTPLSATLGARGGPSGKRLKGQKKKGGKLLVDLVKLARIANSPVLGKGLAEFEVAFTNP
jgi:hypothetical protein